MIISKVDQGPFTKPDPYPMLMQHVKDGAIALFQDEENYIILCSDNKHFKVGKTYSVVSAKMAMNWQWFTGVLTLSNGGGQ